ncbi:hypothetical protein ACFQE1_09750 [Halobium palmae]|uniref:Small CPxCG-related zinc finger protein n=1 Tax=Halobium palmae TaxID=1776492 RepID=A0ABD5RZ84_9EURY
MSTCPRCETTHSVEELSRHEYPRLVLVHCPTCDRLLGRYRRHGDAPGTDHLRDG